MYPSSSNTLTTPSHQQNHQQNLVKLLLLVFLTLFSSLLGAASMDSANNPPGKTMLNTKPQPTLRFDGVFDLYENNRREGIGNYITPDLALVSYALIKSRLLIAKEKFQYAPLLTQILTALHKKAQLNPNTDAASIANRDFLAILHHLLQENSQTPLSPRAQQELSLITQAEGLKASPLWSYPIDYSQLKLRGHYRQEKSLRRYFKAMRYANTVLFPFVASPATQVSETLAQRSIQQALQLTQWIEEDVTLQSRYTQLNQDLDWSVGRAEEFDARSLSQALAEISNPTQTNLLNDLPNYLPQYAQQHQLVPQIISQWLDLSKLATQQNAQQVLIGFRLFAGRYTLDSGIMQQLVFRQPGRLIYQGAAKPLPFSASSMNGSIVKAYPRLDELMHLAGSSLAAEGLKKSQDNQYSQYAQQFAQARQLVAQENQLANLSSAEWQLMNTVLSTTENAQSLRQMRVFWTYRRYLQQLYAKQSYTPMFKSLPAPDARHKADIQPASSFYQALHKLVEQQLQHAVTTDSSAAKLWSDFAQILEKLLQLSQAREQGSLTSSQMQYLNNLDRLLKRLSGDKDRPIVVDVHTHAGDKQVLQQAVGRTQAITYTLDKSSLRGAMVSQCEFKQALNNRLTDEQWRARLQQQPFACSSIQ